MATIRRATPKDLPHVIALLRALHAESVFRDIAIDDHRLRSFVEFCLSHPSQVCILHESRDGSAIDGLMLGYVTPYLFSTELGAWDHAIYVRPERRGSIIAYRLWREFRKWAAEAKARVMWLGTSAGIAPSRTRKFYTGLGMVEVGTLYRQALTAPDSRKT
jgi:GNAT superfamily N-acetyltransferase